MKTYYKATRPDGTDFRTGTVDYAAHLDSGKPLKRLTADFYDCCTPTVYHASDTPSETLIGGSWPCRLFEVTGRPVATEGHKFGFRSMRVVREIEGWRALGPNGDKVAAIVERAKSATQGEVEQLGAAWDAAWGPARGAGRGAAWGAGRGAAWDAARGAAWGAARGAPWGDAAWGAACGTVVLELLTEDQFTVLAGPWISVMGDFR